MTTATVNRGPTKTFTAGAALAKYRRVRLSSGVLAYCGTGDTDCLGTLYAATFASGDLATVTLTNAEGTHLVVASEAISAGAACYAAADGKVASTGTVLVGEVLTAATTNGDVIEILPSTAAIIGEVDRSSITQDALAIYTVPLNRMGVTATLALLGASAGTPTGAPALTPGTHGSASPILTSEAANNNSKTNVCRFLFALPAEYDAGETITCRVRAKVGGALAVAQTVDIEAYKSDLGAGVGSDLCATAAQAVTTSYANYDFTITPTGLVAGDLLDIELTMVANDTGGSANQAITIGAVQMLLDVRG